MPSFVGMLDRVRRYVGWSRNTEAKGRRVVRRFDGAQFCLKPSEEILSRRRPQNAPSGAASVSISYVDLQNNVASISFLVFSNN